MLSLLPFPSMKKIIDIENNTRINFTLSFDPLGVFDISFFFFNLSAVTILEPGSRPCVFLAFLFHDLCFLKCFPMYIPVPKSI